MDRRQIAAKLVLDNLGLDFQMDSFENRLILQKAIYLAQAAGVDLGYYFNWYLHGPYCSPLASDGFAIQQEISGGSREIETWHLGETIKTTLGKVKSWFVEADKEKLAHRVELLASVHFLMSRKNMINPSDIYRVCEEYKKGFSLEEINTGMKELRRYGII